MITYGINLKNIDTATIKDIIDKEMPFCFLPGFNPNPILMWQRAEIEIENNIPLEKIECRNLKFDLMIKTSDLIDQLESLLTNQLSIFQSTKRLPGTLLLEKIEPDDRWEILVKNGCRHNIWINYEFVEITTIDKTYRDRIRKEYGSFV